MLNGLALDDALRWTERLTGLAIFVGTLELLALRRHCSDDGIWRWRTLQPELPWLAPLLAYRPFVAVLFLQAATAMALMAGAGRGTALVLWITSLLVCLRFRGTFNGGSDAMQMVLLSALVLAQWDPSRPVLVQAALLYIAVQLTLSYVLGGIAKWRQAEWRRGTALAAFVESPQYGVPPMLQRLLRRPRISMAASAGILLFECAMPVAWFSTATALVVVGMAFGFHLANVALFGLNRFLLLWTAAYPALLYAASRS